MTSRAARILTALGLVLATIGVIATTSSQAAAYSPCRFSRITVSVGSTRQDVAGYPSGSRVTPIYFTNRGPVCHLLLGGPVVRAFRSYHVSKKVTDTEQSVPAMTTDASSPVLAEGTRYEAVFEVVQLSKSSMRSRACGEATASGFVVEGYALPASYWEYFPRTLKHVCFYFGPGALVSNIGIKWVGVA